MKNVFLFLLICAVVPNFLYADCGRVVKTIKTRDQYLYVKDGNGYVELECGPCFGLMFMGPGHIYKGKTIKDAKMYKCKGDLLMIDVRWKETNEMFKEDKFLHSSIDSAVAYKNNIYIDCFDEEEMRKGYCTNGRAFVLSNSVKNELDRKQAELGAAKADLEYEQAMRASEAEEYDNIIKALNNPTKAQTTTSAKTVEERCQEYNGGQPCSAERLACYKKGSATTWEKDKCKCKDENREWKNGECVAKSGTATINDDSVCKTPLGDLAVAHSFKDLSIENCKDIEKTDKEELVESWEMVCRTGLKIVCKPHTCTDGYEPDFKFGKCVLAGQTKLKSNEKSEQDDAKQQEIENAERVVRDFFASAERNANVWRDKGGKFNTARLASDVTAGVILGTVGGVVSSVVIKKKQVEKGFDALHCTVGGQAVADWGDTFRVGIAK